MLLENIKDALKKRATIFRTGGIRPTGALLESWIGSVRWKAERDLWPEDETGERLTPVAMLFVEKLPYVPDPLNDTALLSVFMSARVFDNLVEENLSPWFVIRRYKSLAGLIPCQWDAAERIRPFPLVPQFVGNDFPMWDGGGMSTDIQTEILRQEEDGALDYFEDVFEENYALHKLGGYPSFCQSGFWFDDSYEYVLQIASDEKARFNVVDGGNFYFYYNRKRDDWKVYCDFY